MNPLLPRKHFVPDAEARVMPDGKLYLYGSYDISGCRDYCSKDYHVFVCEDEKLEHWTDCGLAFRNTAQEPGIPWMPDTVLYAPDAIERNGKYYLYMCGCNGFEGVAVADAPGGPFTAAQPLVGADMDGIDPSVFVDDDGQAYYFWGQFRLKGAKLNEDMVSLDLSSINEGILTETEHGFHEGSSIRKHNGKYYMIYTDISRGRATCMSYAVADAPMGPYKRGGVIVDNTYCDPASWNNHGSILEYKGQWYIFYHRSSQNSNTSRRVCVEKIHFNEDGSIDEVRMTSQGASDPICAVQWIDASVACRIKGGLYIAPQAGCDADAPNEVLTCAGKGDCIEDWAEYRYIDFGAGVSRFTIRAKGEGKAMVLAEGNRILGSADIHGQEYHECTCALTAGLCGVQPLWLLFKGENMEIDAFRFDA